MGDRVKVICKSVYRVSPAIYAHGLGSEAQSVITEAWVDMRHGDASYAAAALCAHFVRRARYDFAPNEISVGLYPGPADLDPKTLSGDFSPGDAGVFVVDVDTGLVEVFGGYEGQQNFSLPMRPLDYHDPNHNHWDQDNRPEIARRAALANVSDKEEGQ